MSEQDVNSIALGALQRRTVITRELSAVRLSLHSGVSEMRRGMDTAKMFLERGPTVSFRAVAGTVSCDQLAAWMARVAELEQQKSQLDVELRALGFDLAG